jgi:hypothetical protein
MFNPRPKSRVNPHATKEENQLLKANLMKSLVSKTLKKLRALQKNKFRRRYKKRLPIIYLALSQNVVVLKKCLALARHLTA